MPKTKPTPRAATLIQVLEYMDGPQAVLLERTADARVVAVAIDRTGYADAFFGAEISRDQWERYRRGFLDLRFLFMFPKYSAWYFFGLKANKKGNIALEPAQKDDYAIEHYVPEPGFFAYDHSEPIETKPSEGLSTQHYRTDGIWELPDFSHFYNKITDLYVFFLSLKKYVADDTRIDLKKRIKDSFSGQPLRGGSSYGNLYGGLLSVQELRDKLSIGKIRYASPGEVDVRGLMDIFDEMAVALNEFGSNYKSVKEKYSILHDYLAKSKLLKADSQRFDKDGAVAKYLHREGKKFANSLRLGDADLIYTLADRNALIFVKILLAHYRRLEKYFMFFAEGRVKEPAGETVPHT
jgi:hypothetical protein